MSKWLIIIGLIIAIVPTVMFQRQFQKLDRQQSEIAVFTLTRPLAKGRTLGPNDVDIELIPGKFDGIYDFAVSTEPDGDPRRLLDSFLGKRLTSDVRKGEMLRYSHFRADPTRRFDAAIAEGMRAITVGVNQTTSVSNSIGPGNQVDVMGVLQSGFSEGRNQFDAQLLLSDVTVLAVGDATTWQAFEERRKQGYSTITLEVTPAQAETFLGQQRQLNGDPIFVLRNSCDTAQAVDGCDYAQGASGASSN